MTADGFLDPIPDAHAVAAKTRAACAHLCHPGQMRRSEDLLRRAQLMHAVIRSRAAFEAFHARDRELRAALTRFRERREAAAVGARA